MQTENIECVITKNTQNWNEKKPEIDTIKTGIIYLITNKINNHNYVGQTTRKLNDRFLEHIKHSKLKNQTSPLYRAIRKYKTENFEVKTLETIKNINRQVIIDKLNELETKYILEYKSFVDWGFGGYNLTTGGNNRVVSESTKSKLRNLNLGKVLNNSTKIKIKQSMTGRVLTNAHKEKLSYKMKNRKINWGNKISIGKSKTYKVYFDNGKIELVKNLKQFSLINGYGQGNLSNLLYKKRNKCKDIIRIEKM